MKETPVLILPNLTLSSLQSLRRELTKFTNDYDDFYLLLSKLAPLVQNSSIGLEATAHCDDNFVHFLNNKDFLCRP